MARVSGLASRHRAHSQLQEVFGEGQGEEGASQVRLNIRHLPFQAGWSVQDLDIVEANEAFAAQAIAVNKAPTSFVLVSFHSRFVKQTGQGDGMGHVQGQCERWRRLLCHRGFAEKFWAALGAFL